MLKKVAESSCLVQCEYLTSQSRYTKDGRKIPVCAGHAALYDLKPK